MNMDTARTPRLRFEAVGAHLPTDWIIGQQLGALAYAITQFHPENLHQSQLSARRARSELFLEKLWEFRQTCVPASLLPAATLRMFEQEALSDALPRKKRHVLAAWDRYGDVSTERMAGDGGHSRPSQLNAAKLIAHQILYSDAQPTAVINALTAFLSNGFRPALTDPEDLHLLAHALAKLRDATAPMLSLTSALDDLVLTLEKRSTSILLVRNSILDHLLGWPLLVFRNNSGAKPLGALSLPVSVEVVFDDQENVEFRSSILSDSGKNVAINDWMGHLRRAADVGKGLWRAKNGNKGTWRDRVTHASIVYDFTILERIMGGARMRANFTDRSMEAYFAQIVLAKLIGRHSGLSAAVSGLIGAQRTRPAEEVLPRRPGLRDWAGSPTADTNHGRAALPAEAESPFDSLILDWHFLRPAGIAEKKRFVYETFKYDRFVLPPCPNQGSDGDRQEYHSYVETNHCWSLSDVADCVQPGGWRQFKYIRCPDVNHAIHKHFKELPALQSPGVFRCLTILSSATKPVVRLPSAISAADLAAALRYINFDRRLKDAFPAPSLTWTIVRATPEEQDLRFWHLLFRRAFSAPDQVFDQVRFAQSAAEAARAIARSLNYQIPDEPRRVEIAPDLLIVVAAKHLDDETATDLLEALRPLAFPVVVDALQKEAIRPVFNKRLRDFIGNARVIIVDSDDPVLAHAARAPDEDQGLLTRLRAFRYGFRHQMASIALRDMVPDPLKLREKLGEMVEGGIATHAAGWYHLRPTVEDVTTNRPALDAAKDHLLAGQAFAPYLIAVPTAGMNLAEALLPENVREAEWHFEKAAQLANRHFYRARTDPVAKSIRTQARSAQQRIIRFFDLPSWGQLLRLSKNRHGLPRSETYELGKEVLARWDAAGKDAPVGGLTIVAAAGQRWWEEARAKRQDDAEQILSEVVGLYERACVHANRAPGFRRELMLRASTRYAAFIRECPLAPTDPGRLRALEASILGDLEQARPGMGLSPVWFEKYADSLPQHSESATFYRGGIDQVPRYFGNWVKYAGALILSGKEPGELLAVLLEETSVPPNDLSEWIFGGLKYMTPSTKTAAGTRWFTGRSFLEPWLKEAAKMS